MYFFFSYFNNIILVLSLLQIKDIVELLDQSARAVRSGPVGSRVPGGAVIPSVKVIRRQTVMVSATITKGVSRMASILLSK